MPTSSAIAAVIVDSPSNEENPVSLDVQAGKLVVEMTRGMRLGETSAWEAFHRQYYLALLRVAAARSHSIDSEAAVQTAYLRIARHIKPFRTEEDFWRWLCCIVRCVIVDLQRERTRSGRLLERFHLWTELWRSRNLHPDHNDLTDALDEALQMMDEADATLIRRKYCEGWSTAELARANDCTEKAIESRLARLRAKLKTQLTGGPTRA